LTFGAFQTYYQHNFLSSSTPSAISWIGTIQSWLLILVGVLSGPLFDLGWFRPMLFAGNFLVIFGIFMLSLSTKYWQVFLAQGVCMGLGAGLLYVPTLALIGLSFSTKRSLAQGITTAGIAVGGVCYIIAFQRVTESRGFGWGVRAMGFIALGIAILAFPALLKGTSALAKARTARKLFEPAAFKEHGFVIFTCCTVATFLGYVVPYFFMSTFAQDALGIDADFSFYVLVISIAASFFGRLFIGVMALKLGAIFTWFCCSLVSGVLSLAWIGVRNRAEMIAFSVFWGFCSGGLVTLPAAVFPRLCPDLKRLGTRTGMSWGISSFATLIGSPIAGALLKRHEPGQSAERARLNYLGPQLWAGAFLMLGAAIILVLWMDTRRRTKLGFFI
jgi:MFS family permease